MDGYGADHKALEKAEADYRARREEAKVWRRERDEVNRQVQEARARQAQKYCVRAEAANDGGGASQEESKGWGDRRVTKEEEVLPS